MCAGNVYVPPKKDTCNMFDYQEEGEIQQRTKNNLNESEGESKLKNKEQKFVTSYQKMRTRTSNNNDVH